VRREIDEIDWTEEEKALRRQWEETVEQMDEAAEEGQEELGKLVDELVKKLEEVGRSDEAQKLKDRFDELTEGS